MIAVETDSDEERTESIEYKATRCSGPVVLPDFGRERSSVTTESRSVDVVTTFLKRSMEWARTTGLLDLVELIA